MDHDQATLRLPPELENNIFALSLSRHLDEGINPENLLLVAKRVARWLIPLYYEVVIPHIIDPWPPSATKERIEQYGHHVHHFHTSSPSMKQFLSMCPNISNLAIWSPISGPDIEAIVKLPMTRLSLNIYNFFRHTNLDLHQFCSRITHLDVSSRVTWATEDVLSHFPVLAHVAMFEDTAEREVQDCLLYAKTLKVLVLVSTGTDRDGLEEVDWGTDHADLRVVHVRFGRTYGGDWKEGAYGRMDMWAFADDVMEKRRQSVKGFKDSRTR
ncbi:hypothetical protein BDN72DRAFT_849509 [Pluteus cervinus]|uniref:Uncharacterized protein n=1 Tax=Pluteus cervinus TaxID=181527 RepID=A0ACD3A6U0_9AGAR|nr:hypothetical protein BDN72DRAFT_849509 [Pluteus cervinus]